MDCHGPQEAVGGGEGEEECHKLPPTDKADHLQHCCNNVVCGS